MQNLLKLQFSLFNYDKFNPAEQQQQKTAKKKDRKLKA